MDANNVKKVSSLLMDNVLDGKIGVLDGRLKTKIYADNVKMDILWLIMDNVHLSHWIVRNWVKRACAHHVSQDFNLFHKLMDAKLQTVLP